MIFGILQLGILGMVAGFGHYAVHCALRSYTVFYSQGDAVAMDKAGRAMKQAFAWCHPMPDLDLEINEETPRSGELALSQYNGRGPLLFTAQMTARVPLLIALRGRKSIELTLHGAMLSEKTVETE